MYVRLMIIGLIILNTYSEIEINAKTNVVKMTTKLPGIPHLHWAMVKSNNLYQTFYKLIEAVNDTFLYLFVCLC